MKDSYSGSETAITALRSLYSGYGYSQFKMSKFEEYDLYLRNKDFLISDQVLTFTDLNGKLMALKPDVTLSIVKSMQAWQGGVKKLYYHENVYRPAGGTRTFRELMQVGLECLGDVGEYEISEVLLLAAESLRSLSDRWVLEISHLGILTEALRAAGIPESRIPEAGKIIGEKNLHELAALCRSSGVPDAQAERLRALVNTCGEARTTLPKLKALLAGWVDAALITELERILGAFSGTEYENSLRLDLSSVSDLRYYNGVVMKGYIEGVPAAVLSGGSYDRLMQKMGRNARAIGFAVYLDLLERLDGDAPRYDADVLLLYDPGESPAIIRACAERLHREGKSVLVQPAAPAESRVRQTAKIQDGSVVYLV